MSEQNQDAEPFTFSYTYFVTLYFVMTWFGLFPSVIVAYFYFTYFPFIFNIVNCLLLIPLFLILYGIALLSSLISTKIGIGLVHKRVGHPQLGTHRFSMDNPQARAWVLKGNIKNFARWLFYFFKIGFLRAFWMRRNGVKLGRNVKLGDFVDDEEFIEIGDNTFMSAFTAFPAHMIDQSTITLLPTKIGKNCIFDFATGGSGGTIGDNSYFKPVTAVVKGNICRGNAIYQGLPIKKIGNFSDLSAEDIKAIKKQIRELDKKDFIKEKNAPIKISELKLTIMKIFIIFGGLLVALLFLYPYILFFKAFYAPGNHLLNILLLSLTPFLFLIILAAFIVGVAVVIKVLLIFYEHKGGEIPEGYYELDDPRAKWFKIKYCLRMFGLKLFHATPFRITDTFAMRFWGNIKLGKFVKIDFAVVDPQYLEVDDFSHIAAMCRIHTHDIVKEKLYIQKVKIGKDVLLGGLTHVKPGVEIADGSIAGIAAWFRRNGKYKRRALYVGKPVVELPIELVGRAKEAKERYID